MAGAPRDWSDSAKCSMTQLKLFQKLCSTQTIVRVGSLAQITGSRAQIVRCDRIADVVRMGQCSLTSSCSRGNPLLKSRTQSVTICVSMRGYEYEREEGGEDTTVASKNRSIVLACSGKSLSASVKEAHKFVNACSIK